MTTPLEGHIRITLVRRGGALTEARIASTRPQLAQQLLAGRAPDDAVRLAGLVFSLCGRAQGRAAALACAAARGRQSNGADDALPVVAELAREHAWRLLIDWPRQAGEPGRPEALVRLRQAGEEAGALTRVLDDLLARDLLGEPAADWLARLAAPTDGLSDWVATGAGLAARLFGGLGEEDEADPGATVLPLLPPLGELGAAGLAELARQALEQPGFCALPAWHGGPAETGAIARAQDEPGIADWQSARGRGAGARLLARLIELARLPERLRQGGPTTMLGVPLDAGLGAAAVETSRGLLLHAVQLAGERVVEYRILAPTEWNFHPDGPLARSLLALAPGAGLEARAGLVARALDPCVDYALELIDA